MSTISPFIRMTLQDLNENVDTWGSVLNISALELLEDAIAGTGSVDVTTGDQTLDDTAGGPSANGPSPVASARFMILDISGTPGANRNVIVPTRSKIYLAVNNTTGGFDITIKTLAGTGPTIAAGEGQFVFCDGTDVLAASAATATLATTATTAVTAAQLNGIDASFYARTNNAQTFINGQVVQRTALTLDTGNVNVDCSESNAFYHLTTGALNLTAPTNATNGQQFSIIIEQGAGAPHAISFQANTFMFAGGVAPSLSTTFGAIDYLAFEYVTGLSQLGGNRWIGSIIKDVSTV